MEYMKEIASKKINEKKVSELYIENFYFFPLNNSDERKILIVIYDTDKKEVCNYEWKKINIVKNQLYNDIETFLNDLSKMPDEDGKEIIAGESKKIETIRKYFQACNAKNTEIENEAKKLFDEYIKSIGNNDIK